jgi:two-component system, OmpR family, phosphate regulon sensor histidine kinase PhoR
MPWDGLWRNVRSRLFWRLGLVYLALLLLVLVAVDIYTVQAIRHDYVQSAIERLEALGQLVHGRPPAARDVAELNEWAAWMAKSGARCTVIGLDGKVLADSERDPAQLENHSSRPEFKAALASREGSAVRHSDTLGKDLVYLAMRDESAEGTPMVVRFAIPLHRLDEALASFRWRLWTASLVILVLAGGVSLLSFRVLTERIDRLKQYSRRVANGDFRPLPMDRTGDELADLATTLNETAAHLDQTIRTLTAERNQSAAILRSMAEGVAVIATNQRLVFCNESFCRALGIESASWSMRPIAEVIRQSDLLGAIQKALAGSETIQSELVVGTVRTRSFAVTAAPVRANGGAAGAVMVLHDISELRRLERARRDFVANVSHEFKTPLTVIQGFAETLLGGALDDPQHRVHFLDIIRSNAVRLGRLTDDLLRLAQIEAGKVQLEFRPGRLGEVIEPCVETARVNAAAKNLTLETECSPDLPAVRGDLSSLQEILQNMLDNAVRYTPETGRISIRAEATDRAVVLSVTDTGIGIPKEHQERIFERFYRVDAARSRELGGTGLGLAITKHLVEAHGGRIEVESEVGRGSTFSVFIPRAQAG